MATVNAQEFASTLFTLLKETFEGPAPETASAYLDQGGGLFQTIDRLSAAEASQRGAGQAPSVAAHCAHVKFYVAVLHKYMRGQPGTVDWKESWLVQAVDETQWEALKKGLRDSYAAVMRELKSVEDWEDESIGAGMAIIAHTAYHLGAIRQLTRRA
jgi:hypothetical protein